MFMFMFVAKRESNEKNNLNSIRNKPDATEVATYPHSHPATTDINLYKIFREFISS